MKNMALMLMSFIVIGGYLFDVYLVLGGKIDTTDANKLVLIGQTIGNLQAMASAVLAYWFGTTKSSSDKDQIIGTMATANTPPVTVKEST